MIPNEVDEIKNIIAAKKLKLKKSHLNFKELNNILGRDEKIRPNLMMELTAHEIMSDSQFLEIISRVFTFDITELVANVNNDFSSSKSPLVIKDKSIENFEEVKDTILSYLKNIRDYYMRKFSTIQGVIEKQDVDIDEMVDEFKIVEKITYNKLDVNEASFKKLEKKYDEILKYIKEKISN